MCNLILISMGLLVSMSSAWADRPQYAYRQLPFNQSLNMDVVYDVTTTNPLDLVNKIKSYGVDILVVRSAAPKIPVNTVLASLKTADAAFLQKTDFGEKDVGQMISRFNSCCNLSSDTILIRDTADTYQLIHEFLHSAIRLNDFDGVAVRDVPQRFKTASRSQGFYQKKVFFDGQKLLESGWRRDILSKSSEVVDLLLQEVKIIYSQEAIIAKVLEKYIDKKSPYYNAAIHKEALIYGETSINQAITKYNEMDSTLNWNKNTVLALNEEVAKGLRVGIDGEEFNESIAQDYAKEMTTLLQKLEPTKAEILKLKSFYTSPF
jgi:predicted nucleic-acid-binding protein